MSDDLTTAVIDFLWACWAELGVPASRRYPFDVAIDVEPLIMLTRTAAGRDPRLRSNAEAWIDQHRELVSRARLKRLASANPVTDEAPFGGRSRIRDRVPAVADSPATLQLRVRSALGISARAEIVRQLLMDPVGTSRPASDLAVLTGYSKRNVEKALESLDRSGWVRRSLGSRTTSWRLADSNALSTLFAPIPGARASFLILADIARGLADLASHGTESADVRSAMARRFVAEHAPRADLGSIDLPFAPNGADAYEALIDWTRRLPSSASRSQA